MIFLPWLECMLNVVQYVVKNLHRHTNDISYLKSFTHKLCSFIGSKRSELTLFCLYYFSTRSVYNQSASSEHSCSCFRTHKRTQLMSVMNGAHVNIARRVVGITITTVYL